MSNPSFPLWPNDRKGARSANRERRQSIDIYRGLAILAMVAYHFEGNPFASV